MRKYNLASLNDIKKLKYHAQGAKILREYTKLHSNFYNTEFEHYDGIAYAPHLLRAIAVLQWSSIEYDPNMDRSIYFYLRLTDEMILQKFNGATLTQIHNFTNIPIETVRRKVNIMINKGWLMKKGKGILQTRKWLHYHIPKAIDETDQMIKAVNNIINLIPKDPLNT